MDAIESEGKVFMAVGRKEIPLNHPDVPPARLGAFYKTKIDQWVREQKGADEN